MRNLVPCPIIKILVVVHRDILPNLMGKVHTVDVQDQMGEVQQYMFRISEQGEIEPDPGLERWGIQMYLSVVEQSPGPQGFSAHLMSLGPVTITPPGLIAHQTGERTFDWGSN